MLSWGADGFDVQIGVGAWLALIFGAALLSFVLWLTLRSIRSLTVPTPEAPVQRVAARARVRMPTKEAAFRLERAMAALERRESTAMDMLERMASDSREQRVWVAAALATLVRERTAHFAAGQRLEDALPAVADALALLGRIQRDGGSELVPIDLDGARIPGAQLANAVWRGVDLRGADLRGAVLMGADLSGARLEGADLGGATLQSADLTDAKLEATSLEGANLSRAKIHHAQLISTNLQGANMKRATITSSVLVNVNLRGAQMHSAQLERSDLVNTSLKGVVLTRAVLVDVHFVNASLVGCQLRTARVDQVQFVNCDLREMDVYGTAFQGTHIIGSDTEGADVRLLQAAGAEDAPPSTLRVDASTGWPAGLRARRAVV